MKPIIVIADDITGAAEMGGIAFRLGFSVQLMIYRGGAPIVPIRTDIIIVATDTRSMSADDAIRETQMLCREIKRGDDTEADSVLFKKTDSALRGHVTAEIKAILENSDYERAVYMPANPSKGRIIRNGVYYINDKPIAETAFAYDPEFPARTSLLSERFPEAGELGILMPDATSGDDLRKTADAADEKTLLAGGADLFEAFLNSHHTHKHSADHLSPVTCQLSPVTCQLSPVTSTLIVCGSTQSSPTDCGFPISYMPTAVYDRKEPASKWAEIAIGEYQKSHSLVLAIRDNHRTGKETAVYLRKTMAAVTRRLIEVHCPQTLIIEGGATAFSILQSLSWEGTYTIEKEIAPGVIQMQSPQKTAVILKPGSYSWGPLFS